MTAYYALIAKLSKQGDEFKIQETYIISSNLGGEYNMYASRI